jgi:hypothetical protein
MKFRKLQQWVVLKIMGQADAWNSMFTDEINRKVIKAFNEHFPKNEDQNFADKTLKEMRVFYRDGMSVMLSVWLTAASLFISAVALIVSIVALFISFMAR